MLAQTLQNNKRGTVLASVLFLALLLYTWHSLRFESFLPAPLLNGGHRQVPIVSVRPREITCPARVGKQSKLQPAPAIRGRSGSAVHGETLSLPKVVALVFYGRRSTVSILDCYLKRNLVSNGGLIDEVLFLRRTKDKADVEFLGRLLESESRYKEREVEYSEAGDFASAYDDLDDDTLYLKIDDDVVFIDDHAILNIICTKITHPEYYIVSANVVNQPMISWMHWTLGAVLPYLPDTENEYPEVQSGEFLDWRASKLPTYDGPEDMKDILKWQSPDDKMHRWLPLRNRKDHILDGTPIVKTEYDPFGRGLAHWQIAAQQHYSFFENLENNELEKYMYNIWDFQYKRVGIQFIAIMGSDINQAKPVSRDDEQHFGVTMPQKFGRHAVADGRAIVAHYSFGPQSVKMPTTDVLARYRSYARENVCADPMLWSPSKPRKPSPEKEEE